MDSDTIVFAFSVSVSEIRHKPPSRSSIGGASAPTIRSRACCARSGAAPAWSAHSPTANYLGVVTRRP